MNRPLLVAGLIVAEVRVLQQRLAHPGHAAVAKDAEASGEEGGLHAVVFHVLVFEKSDQRLGHGQANGGGLVHEISPFVRGTIVL